MNSTSIYTRLCNSRNHLKESWKPVGSGLERHRILPAHQGGTYEDSNCTYLTPREHVLAHYLLWRIHGHVEDQMTYRMMLGIKPENYPSRLGRTTPEKTKRKMSVAHTGKTLSGETRHRISETLKGKSPSQETRRKLSKAGRGRICSEETRRKLSEAKQGITFSEESRRKMSESKRGFKWWNNGKEAKCQKECPGPEWKRGRI